MALYKPSELAQHLENLGISPKKGLSQNFLLDGNVLRKIVSLAEINPGDVVIEIGPGPGALTETLLEAGAHVIAIEKDRALAEALKSLKHTKGTLEVYCDDVLEFPIAEVLKRQLKEGQKAKVVANLPYNITTPIITQLVPLNGLISTIVVMVQDEVALRFTSQPGNKIYGSITVFLNFYTNPRYGFKVSANCFYPKPGVSSAIVRFDLKNPPEVKSVDDFFVMTRTAFGQRRKMMRSTLKDLYSQELIVNSLKAIGLKETARPEELSVDEFVNLFHLIHEKSRLQNLG